MKLGFALCGSFCTHSAAIEQAEVLKARGDTLLPILSDAVTRTDTRFGTARALREKLESLAETPCIDSIVEAEPLGPKLRLDALLIVPCTGNTLAKLANGITDTPVTMAAKAHLRTGRPLIIAAASNDAMSANLRNLGMLLLRKHVYFVPMRQDDPVGKPFSLVADFSLLPEALDAAMHGVQLRPLFR